MKTLSDCEQTKQALINELQHTLTLRYWKLHIEELKKQSKKSANTKNSNNG